MKIINPNMAGQSFCYRTEDGQSATAVCDAAGAVDLPEATAQMLKNTPGWFEPAQRAPRKTTAAPEAPVVSPEESEEPEEGEEPEEASEEPEEGEEVPPYSEWTYAALKEEVRKRMEDPEFQVPDSKKADDIIKALELDDQRDDG